MNELEQAIVVVIIFFVVMVVGTLMLFSVGVFDGNCFPYGSSLEFGEANSTPTIAIEFRLPNLTSEVGRVVWTPTARGTYRWQTLDVPAEENLGSCEWDYWATLRDVEAILNHESREDDTLPLPKDMEDYLVGIRTLQGE